MDELLVDLYKLPAGLYIQDEKITTLGYADDIIVMSSTRREQQHHLRLCQRFFNRRTMAINPNKCAHLAVNRLPHVGKLYETSNTKMFIGAQELSEGRRVIQVLGTPMQLLRLEGAS